MRVPEYLAEKRVSFETLVHPPAFTAQKRAKYLHVSGRQVAKSVLLIGPSGYLLAVLPATHHVDTNHLAGSLGGPVRVASDDEIAKVFVDCEWGVVPPFGTLYGLPTILDDGIASDALMVFEASSHAVAIRMRCRDFELLERPQRLNLSQRSSQ